jgi:hypothetical protein
VLIAGCASGYSEFYRSVPGATPEAIANTRSAPPPKSPLLNHDGGNPKSVVEAYARQGYALIGYSSFNSGRRVSDSDALEQGEKVEADVVVVMNPQYTGSVTSNVPITTPTSTTSYTTGTATVYGPAGVATAYGNATTTTYGTQTSYVPFTVNRFDYGALYFVKRHYVFGVNYRDPSDDERRALQSNKGVYVTSVITGSPAFRSDILPGDLIVSIDGMQVYGQQGCSELLQQKRGQTITVAIVRAGQELSKSVALAE